MIFYNNNLEKNYLIWWILDELFIKNNSYQGGQDLKVQRTCDLLTYNKISIGKESKTIIVKDQKTFFLNH
jgi:hypothetical protein